MSILEIIIRVIPYYLVILTNVIRYSHYYDLIFSIYLSKVKRVFIKYPLGNAITITEVLRYFENKQLVSHVSSLMKHNSFHELMQHVSMGKKIGNKFYYHVSAPNMGYDAFSCDPDDLLKLESERNIGLMTFYEKKMLFQGNPNGQVKKVIKDMKTYSSSKVTFKDESYNGARPCSVDELEVGTFSKNCYHTLKGNPKINSIDSLTPKLSLKDYSDFYVKVLINKQKSSLRGDTIITESAFEELKWFHYLLELDTERCLYINDLLEENPLFPLIVKS